MQNMALLLSAVEEKSLTQKMETPTFGYLSTKDALLIRDALLLECDAFHNNGQQTRQDQRSY